MSEKTLSDLLLAVRRRFADAGLEEAGSDARHLIAGLLGLSQTDFLTRPDRPVTEDEERLIEAAVRRRIGREPVHRILGRREFYGLELALSPETLEPRPDTEVLVEEALACLAGRAHPRIVDFGTGTGAIALALLSECQDARALGIDLSEEALETAMANAKRLGLSERFSVRRSDWGDAVDERFDLIVSNPPYIASAVIEELSPDVRLFDPMLALDGGADGLDAYRALAAQADRLLKPDGRIALEIGYDQRESVTDLFGRAGFACLRAVRDLGGNDRVLVFARQG